MKLNIFLVLSMTLSLQAYDLKEIIHSLDTSKKAKEIEQKSYANIASNALGTAYEAPEFGMSATEVKLNDKSDNGLEYSLGISQSIAQPFASKSKKRATAAMTNSIKQEAKHEFHVFVLHTVSLYHDVCIAKELKEQANVLYEDQEKMFQQVQRSYDLGEVSKKSLLLNKLELMKLEQKISIYKRAYEIDLHSLQSGVDSLEIKEVSCDDMFEIKRDIELIPLEEHGEVKRIEFEKDASASYLNVYDAMLQGVAYEVSYERELDAKRYGFGLSIPLSSFTDSNEIAKKEYLHKNAALNFEKDTLMQGVKSTSASLQVKLQTLYDEYTLVENEILPLNTELLRLSKSAYLEGEGSAMEFLYASRSYSEYMIEILQIKKDYYNQLFELYKTADLELGEGYENIK